MNSLLSATQVFKSYRKGPAEVSVLRGLDLQMGEGDRIAIVGASGVGKSTLLHLLGGLDRPTSGEIRFRGRSIWSASENELAEYRNRSIGFVFQFHYLLPEFTALENVAMPLIMRKRDRPEALKEAEKLLSAVGLQERIRHRPFELSGGEQQRVAIARAMISEPALLLADEPTGNLDGDTALHVMNLLLDVVRNRNGSLILVTHNLELASRTDRVFRLDHGILSAVGSGG